MSEEFHSGHFSSGRLYLRRDLEFATLKREHRARSSKCLVCFLAGFVLLCIIVLIFASIVMRVKRPNVELKSVTVKNLRYSNAPSPSFNATMVAKMTIKNMNFGYFKFEGGVANVQYRGMIVGKNRIGHGFANVMGTKEMIVTVDLRSDKASDSLSNDINSGILELSSYAKFSGRVSSMKIINSMKTAEMNCTMSLGLASSTIKDLICK